MKALAWSPHQVSTCIYTSLFTHLIHVLLTFTYLQITCTMYVSKCNFMSYKYVCVPPNFTYLHLCILTICKRLHLYSLSLSPYSMVYWPQEEVLLIERYVFGTSSLDNVFNRWTQVHRCVTSLGLIALQSLWVLMVILRTKSSYGDTLRWYI